MLQVPNGKQFKEAESNSSRGWSVRV